MGDQRYSISKLTMREVEMILDMLRREEDHQRTYHMEDYEQECVRLRLKIAAQTKQED